MGINEKKKQSFLSRTSSVLKRRGWLQIDGNESGLIRSEKPVWVTETGIVVGNIVAPEVVISGLLHGSVVAQELVVEGGGRIWGDVHAKSINLEEGAFVQGWLGTLSSEDRFQALLDGIHRSNDWRAEERGEIDKNLLPHDLREITPESLLNVDTRRSQMRRLQEEAGRAIVQYEKLSHDFSEQVAESAGITSGELKFLQSELASISEQNHSWESYNQQLELKLDEVKEKFASLQIEDEERRKEFGRLETTYATQTAVLTEVAQKKEELDEAFATSSEQMRDLQEAYDQLQAKEQEAGQRIIEQEEVLLQWQELVKKNEQKVASLEKELVKIEKERDKHQQMATKLRQQRDDYRVDWEGINNSYEALKATNPVSQEEVDLLTEQLNGTKEEYAQFVVENETIRTKYTGLIDSLAKEKRLREEAHFQIVDLETTLTKSRNEIKEIISKASREREKLEKKLKEVASKGKTEKEHLKAELATITEALSIAVSDKELHLAEIDRLTKIEEVLEARSEKENRVFVAKLQSLQDQLKWQKEESGSNLENLQAKLARLQEQYVEASTTAATASKKADDQVQQVRFETELILAEKGEAVLQMEALVSETSEDAAQKEAEAKRREEQLQQQISELRQTLQESYDLATEKTERLKADILEMSTSVMLADQKEENLLFLQQQLREKEEAIHILQESAAGQLVEVEQLDRDLADQAAVFQAEKERILIEFTQLKNHVESRDLQLEAQEKENEIYYQQTKDQGDRLAELRVSLVNRDLELAGVQKELQKRENELDRVKKEAKAYIRKLELNVTQLRQQLKNQAEQLARIKKQE